MNYEDLRMRLAKQTHKGDLQSRSNSFVTHTQVTAAMTHAMDTTKSVVQTDPRYMAIVSSSV